MTATAENTLAAVRQHMDQGRFVDAYEASQSLGPLGTWRGSEQRHLAGQLARRLGGSRLGETIWALCGREHPDCPQAQLLAYKAHLSRRGPALTWHRLETSPPPTTQDPMLQAHWLAFRSSIHAAMRDFECADQLMAQAMALAPQSLDVLWYQSNVLMQEDRYEASLNVAQDVLAQHPKDLATLCQVAHLLNLQGETNAALALLKTAANDMQSGDLHCQVGLLHLAANNHDAARQAFERGMPYLVLLDPQKSDAWLNRVRSDLACACGQHGKGLQLLEALDARDKGRFHQQVEKHLRAHKGPATRKLLEVPFIRQHHNTCAPATLAMLNTYWQLPADQQAIADAICHDGTPRHAEKSWAEGQGHFAQEFTVDLAITQQLIDRGVPFTLSTTTPTRGHLQAVIGYDTARQTLLLRDPFHAQTSEMLAQHLIDNEGPSGPRGMVIFPNDQRHRLDGIALPDADLWNIHHQLHKALSDNDRTQAAQCLKQALACAPDHSLTWAMQLTLANDNRDPIQQGKILSVLAKRHPKCQTIQWQQVLSLQELGKDKEKAQLLANMCKQKDSHLVFHQEQARVLNQDGRQTRKIRSAWRRILTLDPTNAEALAGYGHHHWSQMAFAEACGFYWLATCAEKHNEHLAMTWFNAQRYAGDANEAIGNLEKRFKRHGAKDPGPGISLYQAHRMLGRADLGFAVLEQAMAWRPDDSGLQIFAIGAYSEHGQNAKAQDMLAKVKGRCGASTWHHTAATVFIDASEHAQALQHTQALLKTNPLDMAAQHKHVYLLKQTQGPQAAMAHLNQAAESHPDHQGLARMRYDNLLDESPEQSLAVLRDLCVKNPLNGWAHRELGFRCIELPNGLEEAKQAAKHAMAIEPNLEASFGLMGVVHTLANETEQAEQCFQKALEQSCEYSYAISEWTKLHPDHAHKAKVFSFALAQIHQQKVVGDAILAYQYLANIHLPSEKVLNDLTAVLGSRPDLWQSWAACIEQNCMTGNLDMALTLANKACKRFPLSAGLWARLANVHRLRLEPDLQIKALQKDLQVAPDHAHAIRELVDCHQKQGHFDKAIQVAEQALLRSPRNASFHMLLARLHWHTQNETAAITAAKRAIECAPTSEEAWDLFADIAHATQNTQPLSQAVQRVAQERPGDPDAWFQVAQHLHRPEDFEARLAALDKAIALQPNRLALYDLKAQLLADAMRYEEAVATCKQGFVGKKPNHHTLGRLAWLEKEQGHIQKAIASMRQIIEEHPQYEWGLSQLYAWCNEARDRQGVMDAAEKLFQIDPNSVYVLGQLAGACLDRLTAMDGSQSQRDAWKTKATASLQRAHQLDPAYIYATDVLLDLYLKDHAFELAQRLLDRSGPYLRPEQALAYQLALASAQNDATKVAEFLDQLLRTPSESNHWIEHAFSQVQDPKLCRKTLLIACKDPTANQHVGTELLRPYLNKQQWRRAEWQLKHIQHNPLAWELAIGALFEGLSRSTVSAIAPARLYKRHRQKLQQANPETWGMVGYALADARQIKHLFRHFSGWENRPDLQSWMLSNLAHGLMRCNRIHEAKAVLEHALNMPPDHCRTRHLIDLAHCETCLGNPERAENLLAYSAPEALPQAYRFKHNITRAALHAMTEPDRKKGQAMAKEYLTRAHHSMPHHKACHASQKARCRVIKIIGKSGNIFDKIKMLGRLLGHNFRLA